MSATGQLEPATPNAGGRSSSALRQGIRFSDTLLLALGYAPMLVVFFINLWERPHYQFFPLALAGAGFMAWIRLKEVPRPLVPGRPLWTLLLLAVSFVCLTMATVMWSPWLGSIAALLGGTSLLWRLGGLPLLRAMLPALVLVLTIIPPPLAADAILIQRLRVLAVAWSSRLLDGLGVTHALSGNVIDLPRQKLLVDEACSGINSVLITLAGCLFYGMWRRRSPIHIILCLVNTLACVLLGNLARITIGAWLRFRYDIDILSGRPHEVVGLGLFVTYLVMIVSADQFLVFLTSPSGSPRPPAESPPLPEPVASPKPAAAPFPRSWLRATAYAFALLGLAGAGLGWAQSRETRTLAAPPNSALRRGATFAMPEQIGPWKRLTTEVPPLQKVETLGVFSQIWHYRQGDTLASLALDYPFRGYHNITVCYVARGWELLEQRRWSEHGTNASPPFAEVRMQNPLGMHGMLWFSAVDERGRWLAGTGLNPGLKRNLLGRLRPSSPDNSVTYQVQVLSTAFNALKPGEREQVRLFYEEARRMLWRQLQAQMQRKT